MPSGGFLSGSKFPVVETIDRRWWATERSFNALLKDRVVDFKFPPKFGAHRADMKHIEAVSDKDFVETVKNFEHKTVLDWGGRGQTANVYEGKSILELWDVVINHHLSFFTPKYSNINEEAKVKYLKECRAAVERVINPVRPPPDMPAPIPVTTFVRKPPPLPVDLPMVRESDFDFEPEPEPNKRKRDDEDEDDVHTDAMGEAKLVEAIEFIARTEAKKAARFFQKERAAWEQENAKLEAETKELKKQRVAAEAALEQARAEAAALEQDNKRKREDNAKLEAETKDLKKRRRDAQFDLKKLQTGLQTLLADK